MGINVEFDLCSKLRKEAVNLLEWQFIKEKDMIFTMAAIDDLIAQIDNPELRDRIQQELKKVVKNKKFGLVFEEHLPECTPLYEMPVKRGATVARFDKVSDIYRVLKIENGIALCQGKNSRN